MRILGIDYGEKRVGFAVSDESQTFARELGILSPAQFLKQVNELVKEHDIVRMVLGWPLNMRGEETKKTREVRTFKEKLERITKLKVSLADERLSSLMAQHLPGGNKDIDSLAAQIILQNFLDRNKK